MGIDGACSVDHERHGQKKKSRGVMKRNKSKIESLQAILVLVLVLFYDLNSWAQKKQEEAQPEMPAKVYNKVAPAVARILCDNRNKVGSGSVVGFSKKGVALILTACHVVARNFEDHIRDPALPLEFHNDILVKIGLDSVYIPARIVPKLALYDATIDIAMIATSVPFVHKKVMKYNRSDGIKPGQKVAAVGFPQSDELSLTVGRITRLQGKFIVFDAKIVPGNSGGPLIDKSGRMIGLSVFTYEDEGYALSMNSVLSVVDGWLKNMKLEETWQRQKYTSFPQRLIKDPFFVIPEIGTIGGTIYLILRKPEQIFGKPPLPPEN
jgi:S1-C subfamily serine protease